MALSQNTYVYMETMEEAKNKDTKSDEDGSTERIGISGRE